VLFRRAFWSNPQNTTIQALAHTVLNTRPLAVFRWLNLKRSTKVSLRKLHSFSRPPLSHLSTFFTLPQTPRHNFSTLLSATQLDSLHFSSKLSDIYRRVVCDSLTCGSLTLLDSGFSCQASLGTFHFVVGVAFRVARNKPRSSTRLTLFTRHLLESLVTFGRLIFKAQAFQH
jgi:hypothetical protein